MRALLLGTALMASCCAASAQSYRAYQVEMEMRFADLERRIERLEQERTDRRDAEQKIEADRQNAARAQLAASCGAYRNNPAAVKLFNDCKAQGSKDASTECLMVRLDELTCHH